MPICRQCGSPNPGSARYCSNCGNRLVAAERPADTTATVPFGTGVPDPDGDGPAFSVDDTAAVEALPPGNALLIVLRGPNAGSRFLLDTDEVTAGRHDSSDIFLDDVTVSRRHAVFQRTPEGYRVRDVGSLNGTYVNRRRIDDVLLAGGDEVQIGKFRLMYFTSTARTAAAAP